MEVYSSPFDDVSDAHERVLPYSVIHDTADRRKAADALSRSVAHLAEVQQIAHVGSWSSISTARNSVGPRSSIGSSDSNCGPRAWLTWMASAMSIQKALP